ncbi:hypothetical protein ACFLWG_02690 [Chloroflexota bacterium]
MRATLYTTTDTEPDDLGINSKTRVNQDSFDTPGKNSYNFGIWGIV